MLTQIRTVLKSEPRLAGRQLSLGMGAFEKSVIATPSDRLGERQLAQAGQGGDRDVDGGGADAALEVAVGVQDKRT